MNMQAGMILASALCIFIGCYTPYLYNLLPYREAAAAYEPYNRLPPVRRPCKSCSSPRSASSC